MEFSEFEIGTRFICHGCEFLCADKGTRVVVALAPKEGWMNGPPYALVEIVFDENDFGGCTPVGGGVAHDSGK